MKNINLQADDQQSQSRINSKKSTERCINIQTLQQRQTIENKDPQAFESIKNKK